MPHKAARIRKEKLPVAVAALPRRLARRQILQQAPELIGPRRLPRHEQQRQRSRSAIQPRIAQPLIGIAAAQRQQAGAAQQMRLLADSQLTEAGRPALHSVQLQALYSAQLREICQPAQRLVQQPPSTCIQPHRARQIAQAQAAQQHDLPAVVAGMPLVPARDRAMPMVGDLLPHHIPRARVHVPAHQHNARQSGASWQSKRSQRGR